MTADDDAWLGAQLRSAFPALYLRLDRDERVVECNRHTADLLGPDTLGRRFTDLLTRFEAGRSAHDLTARDTLHRVNFMTVAELPLTLVCTFHAAGDDVLVVGSPDPLEQETLRRELLYSNQSLANRSRELQRTVASLEESNRLKTRFVGMAAHDLRSPLAALQMLADEMTYDLQEGVGAQLCDVQTMASTVAFMRRIVDDFLDVALIDAGRLHLHLAPASLLAIAREARRMATAQARRKGVSIELQAAQDATCVCDAARLQQVFMNLLNNAVEHSSKGQTVIWRLEPQGNAVCVHVEDQGPGVDEHLRENLFAAFVHGHEQRSGDRRIGLGLSISRRIVQAHAGEISLRSTSAGSVFTVRLPLCGPTLT